MGMVREKTGGVSRTGMEGQKGKGKKRDRKRGGDRVGKEESRETTQMVKRK